MADTGNSITGYMLAKLDKIMDRQDELRELIRGLSTEPRPQGERARKKSSLLSRIPSLPIFWQTLFGGVGAWVIGQACKAFLDAGGKPLELIEAVMKLLL